MVWPTLGSRTTKEQNITITITITTTKTTPTTTTTTTTNTTTTTTTWRVVGGLAQLVATLVRSTKLLYAGPG